MSYYDIVPSDYIEGPAGTPGWQGAPVPGWGTNPFRAGPVRVGIGQEVLVEDEIDYAPPPGTMRIRNALLLSMLAGGLAFVLGRAVGQERGYTEGRSDRGKWKWASE